MPARPLINKIKADPKKWSEKSQCSVAASFKFEYTDIQYRCWHCQTEAVFSALDQKHTFEIKKASINQRRILCETCWSQSLHLAAELNECVVKWDESKCSLKIDEIFLSYWLQLLVEQETYVPYRRDSARKNMLRKLLRIVALSIKTDDVKDGF
ncbi:hypothetical protein AAKU61_000218 [Undibacterium sp. GrIS 1.2]|uniref:zinc-ribbon domain containing protein n=1 Tax=Undibacterium sp. GrIS 1.2 TaxID=3143933 RepID=UPI0033990594